MSGQRAAQLVEAGLWLRLSGDQEGAKRLFEQALRLDPANVRARQLLEAVAPPKVEAIEPAADPFKAPAPPPPSVSPMDLDWGMATGFEQTPTPIAPPVAPAVPPVSGVTWSAPAAPPLPTPEPELIEPEWESATQPQTLVFGAKGASPSAPVPAAPTAPAWPGSSQTMHFGEVPTQSRPTAEGKPWSEYLTADTRPGTTTLADELDWEDLVAGAPTQPEVPVVSPPTSSTMVFGSQPPPTMPPLAPAPSGGTMQFAGASSVTPLAPPPPSSTLMFARPGGQPVPPAPVVPPPAVTPVGPGPADDEPFPDVTESFDIEIDEPPAKPPAPSSPELARDATSAWDKRSNPGITITKTDSGMGSALDIVDPPPVPSPPPAPSAPRPDELEVLLRGAKDLLELDDHTGAMELILKAQSLQPEHPEVRALRDRSERTLQTMYESKLGSLDATPRVRLKDDEIIWLNLDHRAGFVLAQIDGSMSFEDVFAVSGMSRLDTARILSQLLEEGVIVR